MHTTYGGGLGAEDSGPLGGDRAMSGMPLFCQRRRRHSGSLPAPGDETVEKYSIYSTPAFAWPRFASLQVQLLLALCQR